MITSSSRTTCCKSLTHQERDIRKSFEGGNKPRPPHDERRNRHLRPRFNKKEKLMKAEQLEYESRTTLLEPILSQHEALVGGA